MIYYIINGLFIGFISYFEYKRYKMIKSIKNIDSGVYARYEWTGWYSTNEPNVKWSVFLTLKEVVKSNDGTKTKFSILDVSAEKSSENSLSDIELYKKRFLEKTGGGWLDTNSKDLLYYGESKTIWEKRNEKLKELGIK